LIGFNELEHRAAAGVQSFLNAIEDRFHKAAHGR
jgi:hypothetical protein